MDRMEIHQVCAQNITHLDIDHFHTLFITRQLRLRKRLSLVIVNFELTSGFLLTHFVKLTVVRI